MEKRVSNSSLQSLVVIHSADPFAKALMCLDSYQLRWSLFTRNYAYVVRYVKLSVEI